MEKIGGNEWRFGVEANNVDVTSLDGGHTLSLSHFVDGGNQVAQARRLFKFQLVRRLGHAALEVLD